MSKFKFEELARKSSKRFLLVASLTALFGLFSAGCRSWYYEMWGGGPPPPDRSHETYYGTGVVTGLEWRHKELDTVLIDFSPHPAALYGVYLETFRSDQVTSKLFVSTQVGNHHSKAWLQQGMPSVGDTAWNVNFGKANISSRPYYPWTGTVETVTIEPWIWKRLSVDFGHNTPPREYVHLLLIRSNQCVGRVMVEYGQKTVWVHKGIAAVGDRLIGVQNLAKYKNQKDADSKSPVKADSPEVNFSKRPTLDN
jgi:hypothetical protein